MISIWILWSNRPQSWGLLWGKRKGWRSIPVRRIWREDGQGIYYLAVERSNRPNSRDNFMRREEVCSIKIPYLLKKGWKNAKTQQHPPTKVSVWAMICVMKNKLLLITRKRVWWSVRQKQLMIASSTMGIPIPMAIFMIRCLRTSKNLCSKRISEDFAYRKITQCRTSLSKVKTAQ